jgi:hypothetical protein
VVTLPEREVELPECACTASCCAACFGLEPGEWGMLWYSGNGEWHCVPGPTVGTKVLKGDPSGPEFANE